MNMIQFKDWIYPCPSWLYDWLDDRYQFGINTQFVDVHGCRDVGKWVVKARRESAWIRTVMLLPSRTDTAWFHDQCAHGDILFLRGRLSAVDVSGYMVGKAGFPHMVVVFSNNNNNSVSYIDTKEIREKRV